MRYQLSVFLIQRKCPASLLMSYLYMETVQFKLSLECLGEIYQQNHWKELNLRTQSLSLLTSAQSGKCIISSLLSSQKMIYPCNLILTNDMLIALFPNLHKLATICLSIPIFTASAEQSFSDMKLIKNRLGNRLNLACPKLSLNLLKNSLIEIWKKLVWNRKVRWIAM